MKLPNLVVIGALCVGVALAASSADVAPADDEILSLDQSRSTLTSPALVLRSRAQPELVATYEVAADHNPAQGLVQKTHELRPRIQESKGGLGMKTASEAVTRPNEPLYSPYRHTNSADPYVYAYC
jgi:hypothetical protein